ncbi:MAG: hypothetical protein ACTS3R_08055 [Inquilinaceae bacterium]
MSEAIFGLFGVFIGALITWARESWSERKSLDRQARYLAIRVVCILDEYIVKCFEVVQDDGLAQGQRNSEGYLEPQFSLPDFPTFPEDVDWKSINHDLMYRVLALPSDAADANRKIQFALNVAAYPPDYEEFFEARQLEYACLGLTALEINQTLRVTYGIPDRKLGDWDPVGKFEERKRSIEQTQTDRQKANAALFESIGTDSKGKT